MANDITSSAAFSFSNMKPDADEDTAALWAQNAADNTGWLYYAHQKIIDVNVCVGLRKGLYGTSHFRKTPRFNTLHGTIHLSADFVGGSDAGGAFFLYIDGTQHSLSYGPNDGDAPKLAFTHDCSVYSDDADVEYSWYINPDGTDNHTDLVFWSAGVAAYGTQV